MLYSKSTKNRISGVWALLINYRLWSLLFCHSFSPHTVDIIPKLGLQKGVRQGELPGKSSSIWSEMFAIFLDYPQIRSSSVYTITCTDRPMYRYKSVWACNNIVVIFQKQRQLVEFLGLPLWSLLTMGVKEKEWRSYFPYYCLHKCRVNVSVSWNISYFRWQIAHFAATRTTGLSTSFPLLLHRLI